MAILMIVLFSLNSLCTAIVASFMNTEWSTLTPTSKILLITVVLQNWTGTLLAFFNKTMSRIESGKSPFESGDTQTFTKSSIQQEPTGNKLV